MIAQETVAGQNGFARASFAELIELHLLLTRHQLSALETVAARLNLTVSAVIHRAISDVLRPGTGTGFAE